MYQYSEGGKRFLPGQWTNDTKAFRSERRGDDLHHATTRRGGEGLSEPGGQLELFERELVLLAQEAFELGRELVA